MAPGRVFDRDQVVAQAVDDAERNDRLRSVRQQRGLELLVDPGPRDNAGPDVGAVLVS